MNQRKPSYHESMVELGRSPSENLIQLGNWLRRLAVIPKHIGVAGTGPVTSLDRGSRMYGVLNQLADSPFAGFSVPEFVRSALRLSVDEVSWISDCAALGLHEYWSTIQREDKYRRIALLRFGWGAGGSLIVNSSDSRGVTYTTTEVGHIPVHHPVYYDDTGPPTCPWHRGCLYSHVNWQSIIQRADIFGIGEEELMRASDPRSQQIWVQVADYIAQACVTVMMMWSPTHIVLTGSLIRSVPFLPELVQELAADKLKGFDAATIQFKWDRLSAKDEDDDAMLAGAVHAAVRHSYSRMVGRNSYREAE